MKSKQSTLMFDSGFSLCLQALKTSTTTNRKPIFAKTIRNIGCITPLSSHIFAGNFEKLRPKF